MNLRRFHQLLRNCLLLAACCAVGCASAGPKPAHKWYDPFGLFHTEEKEGPKVKIVTPAERVKILRELTKKAKSLPPPEQERATDELCQALPKEKDVLVRAEMLRTIAVFPSPRAEAMLNAGMRDADQDVRIACCDAWGSRGGAQANHVLCETLTSDPDRDVRMAAARGLGQMKDPHSVGSLVLALDDSDPAIQFCAMRSLQAITGKKFQSAKEWRDYSERNASQPPSAVAGWKRLLRF